MAAINFPSSPSVNDTFAVGGVVYTWTGTSWKSVFAEVTTGVSPGRAIALALILS